MKLWRGIIFKKFSRKLDICSKKLIKSISQIHEGKNFICRFSGRVKRTHRTPDKNLCASVSISHFFYCYNSFLSFHVLNLLCAVLILLDRWPFEKSQNSKKLMKKNYASKFKVKSTPEYAFTLVSETCLSRCNVIIEGQITSAISFF